MKDDATFHDAKLQELAQRLGTRAAERLDVERAAQAVVARLREERRAPLRGTWTWRRPAWLKIAAALVVVVGAGVVARGVWPARPGVTLPVETVDLSDMSAPQLRELLRSVEQPGDEGGAAEPVWSQDVGLEDLSPAQLRALLASMEMET